MIKAVLLSVLATAATMIFAAKLFLSSILGFFNLAAVPLEAMQKLRASQEIVEKMKTRNAERKVRVTKRFVKKAGRRVAASALAATTVGTVAVAVVVTGMEINSYCDDKAELQADENLLNGTSDRFDYDACIEAAREDSIKILDEAKASTTAAASEALGASREVVKKKWGSVKGAIRGASESTTAKVEDWWNSVRAWF
jgi:hypothetical protein